jgi:chemotaxis protein CheD
MLLFERSVKRLHTNISDYQAKIFGGGNMYDKVSASQSDDVQNQPIGDKNAAIAFRLLMEAGANILVAHVGEQGHRRIVFDIGSGDVWVRFAAAKNSRGDVRSLDGRS